MKGKVGYSWLAEQYGLTPAQRPRVWSSVGASKATERNGPTENRTYAEYMWPGESLGDHVTFALKHEGFNLELLSRLFAAVPAERWISWIQSEPLGQYARRAGFLYEWMTGQALDVPSLSYGNYVDLLDPGEYLTSPHPENNNRWRVRDNLLGSPEYCPIVTLNDAVRQALDLDVARKIGELEGEFGEELLMKSAVWLTLKESRASFAIEHEENQLDRVNRFASVIERLTGELPDPLDRNALGNLQKEILGKALALGLRQSPVFVGTSGPFDSTIIYYIGPHPERLQGMLDGLNTTRRRTEGLSSVARAAILSFGFVYIHPMSDGNGRISRFLINDILRRDGALPKPYIIPVSATLQAKKLQPQSYDEVLDSFSKPFMRRYNGGWRFGQETQYADGIYSDFYFEHYDDALHAWRFPDMTDHVAFMGQAIQITIDHEMRKEAHILKGYHAARESIKEVIEGPNAVLDQIIGSVLETKGRISKKLKAQHPQLAEPDIEERVLAAVRRAFPTEFPTSSAENG